MDSRTGLTEIGGISTVQFPDIIVLLFTATDQAFEGAIDIIQRASMARQKLPFQRVQIPVIPIPSRLDVQAEFRLSQKWLDRFARELGEIYSSWLPRSINPRALLDITKLPHISFFSYGESLPVFEHGNSDPGGLGQAYENLSALLARNLQNVELLLDSRGSYIKKAARSTPERSVKESEARIFISSSHEDEVWLEKLQILLKPLTESRSLSIWTDRDLESGMNWREMISSEISQATVAVLLVSSNYLASDYVVKNELPNILIAAEGQGLKVLWIALDHSFYEDTEISRFQALNDPNKPLSSLKKAEQNRVLHKAVEKIVDAAGRSY